MVEDNWIFKRQEGFWIPKVILGDVREVIDFIPDNFIDCIITSPPYWMQRDYGNPAQIGRESRPEEYIREIVGVFERLRAKLKRTATIFLNVGYKYLNGELLLIPEMIALEMQKKGFTLKNKIIWWKPNAMPTPARDRLNEVYEPVLFFIRDDGKEVHYFNLEEISEKPKTLEHYMRLLSVSPRDLLGVRVVDSISARCRKEGKVVGVRYSSTSPVAVLVQWNENGEEWIPLGNPLKNYPEEIKFTCPLCSGELSSWDIKLSLANLRKVMCPECGAVLCNSSETFPIPVTKSETKYENIQEIIDYNVEAKKYITKVPKSSKFLKAGLKELAMASPAGRLAVVGEYLTVKRRWNIPQLLVALYLKYWRELRGISTEEVEEKMGYSYTAAHWFRLDFGWWGKGGSIPRPLDWIKLKDLLKFDELYDNLITEKVAVLQTVKPHEEGRNPGDVWEILLEQYPEAHFSTFPTKLVEMALKVGCPPNGVVLDPFAGSGTVGEVAMRLNRKAILIELIPEFLDLIRKRCKNKIEVLTLKQSTRELDFSDSADINVK
jgi:DNA modification methylase